MLSSIKSIFKTNQKNNLNKDSKTNKMKKVTLQTPNPSSHTPVPTLVSNSKAYPSPPEHQFDAKTGERLPVFPTLASQYRLIQRMGDGAFSVVYRAYDQHRGHEVAIKAVRKHELSQSQRASIHKEISILRSCDHPNITQLYDFHESNMHYFIIMELVSGGELFNAIVDHTYFSEPLARHIINQVAEGIHYLHNQCGVVHRDIKPENILFEPIPIIEDPQSYIDQGYKVYPGRGKEGYIVEGLGGAGIGRVKIADFGLSKTIWSNNTMTPCGTVGYTAPEIVNDQRYSLSVDLWALGCVLYTMLCGFPPFYDEDIQVLTEKVAHGYYTFLSPWWDPVSDGAKDIVAHLLLVDPAQRYTIDEFMCHPWCHIVNPPSPPAQHDLVQTPTQEFAVSSVITPSVTLREAFDVSYAVHLMGDDHHREIRAKNKHQRRQQAAAAAAAAPQMIPIVETPTEGTVQGFNYEAHNLLEGLMCREAKKNGGEFQFSLNADNATLLNRRKNKNNIQQAQVVQA